MQQFNQIFNFLYFVPNFLLKNKKIIKSQKQKFFFFVGSHSHILKVFANFLQTWPSTSMTKTVT